MRARCGHYESNSYAKAHYGLCRRCHSDFAYLVELEEKHGEDALVEYWYSQILANLSESKEAGLPYRSPDRLLPAQAGRDPVKASLHYKDALHAALSQGTL